MSTSEAAEREELRRWQPLGGGSNHTWPERLVINEFRPADELHAEMCRKLAAICRHACVNSPYYRKLFMDLGLGPDAVNTPEDLLALPVLRKQDIQRHGISMVSELHPENGRLVMHRSSGTTGRPVDVWMSPRSYHMFTVLWQRQARWFRFDPTQTIAKIRRATQLPFREDGSPNPDGATTRRPRWQYVGNLFETGSEIGFNSTNAAEQQVAWLREHRPAYLMSYPSILEELALAAGCACPVDSLQSVVGISTGANDALRSSIERHYGIPFHQSYGLNEIGLIATRCEEGRYHVHNEHCFVEIVDEENRPCRPGETGRLLATSLDNLAMPILRYDCDDMAVAADGPCRCGRTLPSFQDIAGRYRRYACLPEGSRTRTDAIEAAVHYMPEELLQGLRRYQIYQYRDNRFELRLTMRGGIPPAFREKVMAAWKDVAGDPPAPLNIVEMERIPAAPGGKVLDFDSAFYYEEEQDTINGGD